MDRVPPERIQLSSTPSIGIDTIAERASNGVAFGRVVLTLAVIYAAALLWSRLQYVPLWDGRIYADCIVSAAIRPFSPGALRCADHPSHAYVALISLLQRLHPGSFPLLLAGNAALLALAAAAVYRILCRVVPVETFAGERLLLVAAFVVHPVVLAGAVQPGLDFGVMVFMLLATAAAVERRSWVMVGFGLLAVFSKETGVLLYALLACAYVLAYALPHPWPRNLRSAFTAAVIVLLAALIVSARWQVGLAVGAFLGGFTFAALRPRPLPDVWQPRVVLGRVLPLMHLALPLLAFGGYLAYRAHLPQQQLLWGGASGPSVLQAVIRPHFGPVARTYLALVLVLGFLWLPMGVLVMDSMAGAYRYMRELPLRPVPEADADPLLLLGAMTVGTIYLLTRYESFSNARYLLPAYPLLLIMLLPALIRLRMRPTWRFGLCTTVVALFALSAVRTADPVSRLLWGTFSVGEHELLRITSLTGECCGAGRDQLVYNLQFTAFDDLDRAALARLQPVARHRTIAVSPFADWYILGPLDAASRRTLLPSSADSASEALYMPWPLRLSSPDSAWYLALPYVDHVDPLIALGRAYTAGQPDTVRAGRYAMAIWPLIRRTPAAMPASVRSAP